MRTADKVGSSISFRLSTPNSANKLTKPLLIGANTVKGEGGDPAGILSNPTKSCVKSSLVKACTNTSKLGSAKAKVTIEGNPITPSTTCTTPLLALTSAVITLETPLKDTPLSVFIS